MAVVQAGTRWACTDCVMFLANGDTPAEMTAAATTAWLLIIAARTPGYTTIVVGVAEHSDQCGPDDREAGCDCGHDEFSRTPVTCAAVPSPAPGTPSYTCKPAREAPPCRRITVSR